MNRPHFQFKSTKKQVIKQMSESKEFDPIQKQLNQIQLKQQTQTKNHQTKNQIIPVITEDKQLKKVNIQHYSSNQVSKTKYSKRLNQYNSGGFNSTQAASPYDKLLYQSNFNDQVKSEQQNSVKKKLFSESKLDESLSPHFNLSSSKFDSLGFTFKKKVEQYPRLFSQTTRQFSDQASGKILYSRLNFFKDLQAQKTNQNDSFKLNFNAEALNQSSSERMSKLKFQQVSLNEQNPLLDKINEQIRRDRQFEIDQDKDYRISRRNQSNLIKRKILQSKSDLKRFYEMDSQNVQYEYRKAKFMDIFLGSKTLQHKIR